MTFFLGWLLGVFTMLVIVPGISLIRFHFEIRAHRKNFEERQKQLIISDTRYN